MGFKAISTSRSAATTAVSKQATIINTGTNFAVTGATISANTSVSINVNTPGQAPNTAVAGLSISSINYLNANGTISTANAVSTTGGNIKINGAGFTSPMTVIVGGTTISNANITVANTSAIIASLGNASPGNVSVYAFNASGTGAQLANGVYYSGVPSWTTSSVSFQNGAAANTQLVVSSDSTLTFTLQAGSVLPTGINLISTGYLSGTATGYSNNTSSTSVIVATDQEGQATQQTITWSVVVGDSQFNYVTLLLNGDTGNNISNAATNNTFIDSSTNNFTITRGGTVTQGSFSPYTATGWSNYFDGSGDYLTVPDNTALQMGAGDFTIEFWINYTSIAGYQTPYSKGYTAAGDIMFQTGNGNGAMIVYLSGSAAITESTGAAVGQWYHYALVRSGTTVTLYRNGVSRGTATSAVNFNTTNQLGIGATGKAPAGGSIGQYAINGYMSNLRVVKGTAVYTSVFTPSTTPLTAISGTSLLTCQSNRFIDNSSNSFSITPAGTPNVQAYSPFVPSASYIPTTNGGSSHFNSASDTLTYGGIAGPQGTEDFTWEVWWYFAPGGIGGSFPRLFETTTANGFQIYLSGGTLVVAQNGGATVLSYSISSYVNQWAHICLTRSGTAMRLFVNGVLQGYTASGGTNFAAASSFRTLTEGGGPVGYMSDLRTVRGSVVSAYSTAVTTTGTSVFTPPTTPLTAVSGTALLCSFTNGAIVDAHASTDIVTVGAALNTATTKFGTASIKFNGSDKLTMPASPNWIFGTGDFTVEFWMNTSDTTAGLITPATTGAGYWALLINSSTLYWQSAFNAANLKSASLSGYLNNTWVHIAIVRYSGTLNFYFNGTAQGVGTADSTNYSGAVNALTIGYDNSATNGYYIGYIDDFRITKGFARYTANFTPPTSAFQGQ